MFQLSANSRKLGLTARNRHKLPFAPAPALRVAQLGIQHKLFDGAEHFPLDGGKELERYRPSVLVGYPGGLQVLAERTRQGMFDMASVDRAVFVVTRCGNRPIGDVLRVVLWQTFGVPVYELLLSAGGALLASECEAHEGWHIEPGVKFSVLHRQLVVNFANKKNVPTGLTGYLQTDACPCGRAGIRILQIEPYAAPIPQKSTAPKTLAATA